MIFLIKRMSIKSSAIPQQTIKLNKFTKIMIP